MPEELEGTNGFDDNPSWYTWRLENWGCKWDSSEVTFIYDHDETIIQRLEKPIIWKNNCNLILTNDSIHQLNLVTDKNMNIK